MRQIIINKILDMNVIPDEMRICPWKLCCDVTMTPQLRWDVSPSTHTGNQTCHQHNIQTMNHKHPPRDLRMLVSLTNHEQALKLEQASSDTRTQAPTPLPLYQLMNPVAPEFFDVYDHDHLSYTSSQESHLNPETSTFAMGNGSKQQSGGKSGSTSGGMSKSDSSKIQSSQVS